MQARKISWIVLIRSSGVPAGAATPRHMAMEKSMPCSKAVGASGNRSKRSSPSTPRDPELTGIHVGEALRCRHIDGINVAAHSSSYRRTATAEGNMEELCPYMVFKGQGDKVGSTASTAVADGDFAGFALAASTNSLRFWYGELAGTMMIQGFSTTMITGAKESVSKGTSLMWILVIIGVAIPRRV